jgi:hypothetical protein
MTVRCKVVIFIYAADILLIQTIRHKLLQNNLCGGESVFAKFASLNSRIAVHVARKIAPCDMALSFRLLAFPQKPKH